MDNLDQLAIVGRRAFVGIEREIRGYPAGVRTIALVALGSALFTDISTITGSEDRIAAGIVTGIGFLGAGVIFREGYTVRGITTAATIWSAAAGRHGRRPRAVPGGRPGLPPHLRAAGGAAGGAALG